MGSKLKFSRSYESHFHGFTCKVLLRFKHRLISRRISELRQTSQNMADLANDRFNLRVRWDLCKKPTALEQENQQLKLGAQRRVSTGRPFKAGMDRNPGAAAGQTANQV